MRFMELNNYIMKKSNRFRIFTSLLMGFLIAGFSSWKDDESQEKHPRCDTEWLYFADDDREKCVVENAYI